jgi:hypothetical protein
VLNYLEYIKMGPVLCVILGYQMLFPVVVDYRTNLSHLQSLVAVWHALFTFFPYMDFSMFFFFFFFEGVYIAIIGGVGI